MADGGAPMNQVEFITLHGTLSDPIDVTLEQFLADIFGPAVHFVHYTQFPDDPSAITVERRGACWAGGHFAAYREGGLLDALLNAYFCVSIFRVDGDRAVRRKANFLAMYVLVLDDVGEKIPYELAERLPRPTFKVQTSPGSEQWGYALAVPETSLGRASNLSDELIRRGLAPDGTDPGMRGVTRYVRPPFGVNSKAKHVEAHGGPYPVHLTEYTPGWKVDIEDIAAAFDCDLDARRVENEGVGAGVWPETAPVMRWLADNTLEDKGEGEYLVECPWIEEHSDGDNSGTWLKTNTDGSGEFKCHHGHCQDRGFNDFLVQTGLRDAHDTWRVLRDVPRAAAASAPVLDFIGGGVDVAVSATPTVAAEGSQYEQLREALHQLPPGDPEAAVPFLAQLARLDLDATVIDALSRDIALHLGVARASVRDSMRNARRSAAAERRAGRGQGDILAGYAIDRRHNKVVDIGTGVPMVPQAFDLALAHHEFADPNNPENVILPSKALALRPDKIVVDGLTWWPGEAQFVDRGRQRWLNTYHPPTMIPVPGDVSPWLRVVEGICGQYAGLVIQHMAFALQYPAVKANWQVFWMGKPRTGKSSVLAPIKRILGDAVGVVKSEDMDSRRGIWGDHFARRKVVIVEEVYQPENRSFYNQLKSRLANDDMEALNMKGGAIVNQPNLYAMYLFSNHGDALHFDENDEKLLVLKVSDHIPGLEEEDARRRFFVDYYRWLDAGGAAAVYAYLLAVDLSAFQYNQLPVKTSAYYEAAQEAMPAYLRFLKEAHEDASAPFDTRAITVQQIKLVLKANGYERVSDKNIAHFLVDLGYVKCRGQCKEGGIHQNTPRFYAPANIAVLSDRERFDWYHGENIEGL